MNNQLEHNTKPEHDDDWPMFLTPELKNQLIQAKTARVLATLNGRDRSTIIHSTTCNAIHCECH